MTHSFDIKTISRDAVPRAIEKAERYRLLNDPEQTESICLDVLAADPENQRTLVLVVLAMTDRLASGGTVDPRVVGAYVARLADEYERIYYSGLVCERQARGYLARGSGGATAYEAFRDAMEWYEKASARRPPDNDDALLRWNSCVRTLQLHRLEPRADEGELPLE